MLLFDGTIAQETAALLNRVQQDATYPIMLYTEWLLQQEHCGEDNHHHQPEGIIYLQTSPDSGPTQLPELPTIVLNGTIDFQTNFAHYYNHLFYIKKFINQIQEQKDQAQGIKKHYRKCC